MSKIIKEKPVKIFVSPEVFRGREVFKKPMARCGICDTKESLGLGEIIVEQDGKQWLVTITADGKPSIKEINES